MKSAIVVSILLCASTTTADPTPSQLPRRLPDKGCVALGAPEIDKTRLQITETAEAAYQVELTRRGLQLTHLPRSVETLTKRGVPVVPIGKVVKGRLGGPISDDDRAPNPPSWQLAKDADGHIYRVTTAIFTSSVTVVTLCGCEPPQCPKWGSPCPACGASKNEKTLELGPVQTNYEMPPGVRFKGDVSIRYGYPALQTTYEKKACPPQRCQDPPKGPPA